MSLALKSAKIDPEDVDYINAHGSSTKANDVAESAAIETVFRAHARRLSVSSTKGATGHCLGAAGAIEAVLTIGAICEGVVPPTANLTSPDPACRLDYTPNEPRSAGFDTRCRTVLDSAARIPAWYFVNSTRQAQSFYSAGRHLDRKSRVER